MRSGSTRVITPTELATVLGLAPTTCSDRVQELVDNGHVERVPNPADGRWVEFESEYPDDLANALRILQDEN